MFYTENLHRIIDQLCCYDIASVNLLERINGNVCWQLSDVQTLYNISGPWPYEDPKWPIHSFYCLPKGGIVELFLWPGDLSASMCGSWLDDLKLLSDILHMVYRMS